ncbi:MAG: hypothetical protein ACLTBR_03315 [Anaerostipes sp.]|uniref:hypothetical protein n=1 Tax=Anaerostipes sp. TaxID=1872530 RepID=UPI0039967669
MNEYTKQAMDFLEKANATIKIDFSGVAINKDWKEKTGRNFYNVTITTPRGSMNFDFWDSINNTEISQMSIEEYAENRFKCNYKDLRWSDKRKAREELKEKKATAKPTAYDVLACLIKDDPGAFEDFCSTFGYDEDSKTADRVYIEVVREYKQLERIFTAEQMKELQEIN